MTTTTKVRTCRLCGTHDMPVDERAQYCEVNGCNAYTGDAYKALNQLLAAQRIAQYLVAEFGCDPVDVARLSTLGRRLVERALNMERRSDSTWALAIALLATDN